MRITIDYNGSILRCKVTDGGKDYDSIASLIPLKQEEYIINKNDMTQEEMQKQIKSMMPTPNQVVESIDKKLEEKRERIVHNILNKFAKKKGLVKYEYPDGFYVFGNPDCQELADKKHEEWIKRNRNAQPYNEDNEDVEKYE